MSLIHLLESVIYGLWTRRHPEWMDTLWFNTVYCSVSLAKERFTAMIWIGVHVPIELPTVDHANDGQRQTQRTKAADGFTGTEMVNGRLEKVPSNTVAWTTFSNARSCTNFLQIHIIVKQKHLQIKMSKLNLNMYLTSQCTLAPIPVS